MNKNIYLFLQFCAVSLLLFHPGVCAQNHNDKETLTNLENSPVESFQNELLSIAFETVSKIPANPHIKSRCLEQQKVVETALEMEQPKKAIEYIEQIDDWRKQLCYADLALYFAQHGSSQKEVEKILKLANQVPEQTEDWRKDQVDLIISQTRSFMEKAKQKPDSFDNEMESLQKLISTGNFDAIQGALEEYSRLYNDYYSSIERRDQIENQIKSSWDKMPVLLRINLLTDMAGFSLNHNDQSKTIELIDNAQKLKDSNTWPVRYEVPLIAKLAGLRFLAGDKDKAQDELKKALGKFDENRETIINIDKAGILRSIAEAYHKIGDTDISCDIYKKAINAGLENPNSRPRAEDLSATCCSMALNKVDPGTELLTQIKQIKDGLSDPW